MNWIQLALTFRSCCTRARHSTSGAWTALRHRSANMNTLIALGTGAAFLYSLVVTFTAGPRAVYFEAAAMILALILLGRVLEAGPAGARPTRFAA